MAEGSPEERCQLLGPVQWHLYSSLKESPFQLLRCSVDLFFKIMATNTGHPSMHVSLTEIYIVVATIYLRLMEQIFPSRLKKVIWLVGGFSWLGLTGLNCSFSSFNPPRHAQVTGTTDDILVFYHSYCS